MTKVLEIDRKSGFLRGPFFHDFLSGQKMEKSGTKTKWESAGIVQGTNFRDPPLPAQQVTKVT